MGSRGARTIYRYRQSTPWGAGLGVAIVALLWGIALWSAVSNDQLGAILFRIAVAGTLLVLFLALTFSSMTIIVNDREIVWWFGVGFPRGRFKLDQLLDATATRTSILEGWGIHLTSRGWLWNLRGLNAVRLRGAHRVVLLGTDRPQELLDAVARARWTSVA
ncbi:MAG TPA: hypothetical protein VIN40_06425 [Candidatus Tyrphobacter sp.]